MHRSSRLSNEAGKGKDYQPLTSLFLLSSTPPHPAASRPTRPLHNLATPVGNTPHHPAARMPAYIGALTLTSFSPLSIALTIFSAKSRGGTVGAAKRASGGGGRCAKSGVCSWPGVARMSEMGLFGFVGDCGERKASSERRELWRASRAALEDV